MFSEENHPDEPQDTAFKRTIIKQIKELKDFKEDEYSLPSELQEDWNKCPSDGQENTNIQMNEIREMIQDLKTEFSQEIEILRRTQDEMKM